MRRVLDPAEALPLTCTRAGTCCHGKDIRITPWELALLARAKGLTPAAFRARFAADGGARLAVDGPAGWRGLPACRMYDPAGGCTVHAARPLACRLYPLGREVQAGAVRIVHDGGRFPCLDGCPEVAGLPALRVADYLAQQEVERPAAVRDAYLEMAQDLAEVAFMLALDGGLDQGADAAWRGLWRRAAGGPLAWVAAMDPAWHDLLTVPALDLPLDDGEAWVAAHAGMLQVTAQRVAERSAALEAVSAGMLASGLLLIHAVGGEAGEAAARWLRRAGCRSAAPA